MKKFILFLFVFTISLSAVCQKDILSAKTRAELVHNLDSAMRPAHFITLSEAENLFEKPAILKDSAYKFSGGVLRFTLDYVVVYADSNSKGRLTFNFEQYKDTAIAKSNYNFIESENRKSGHFTEIKQLGNNAFLTEDQFNQPFIMAIKANRIYKFRLMYLTTEQASTRFLQLAKETMVRY